MPAAGQLAPRVIDATDADEHAAAMFADRESVAGALQQPRKRLQRRQEPEADEPCRKAEQALQRLRLRADPGESRLQAGKARRQQLEIRRIHQQEFAAAQRLNPGGATVTRIASISPRPEAGCPSRSTVTCLPA